LAPDEDGIADRIAERVGLQMEYTYARRLQESQSRGTPVMAVKLHVEDDKSNQDDEESFFCGFSKSCVMWTRLAFLLLLLVGGLVGGLFGAGIVGGEDGTDDGVVVAPTEPPLVPASPSPTAGPVRTANPTDSPTVRSETGRFETLWNLIGADVADDPMTFWVRDSPPYKALKWMANQDPAMNSFEEVYKSTLIGRYAMVLFYFQTGQAADLETLGFLSALPVCGWYSEEEEKGVQCNGPFVTELRLGKYTSYGIGHARETIFVPALA
jgi:hypothetical protein